MPIDKPFYRPVRKPKALPPKLTRIIKLSKGGPVNGDEDKQHIRTFVDQHLLSRDSIVLRTEISRISPDIELSQEIEIGGESVKVVIPMTVGFFWPEA